MFEWFRKEDETINWNEIFLLHWLVSINNGFDRLINGTGLLQHTDTAELAGILPCFMFLEYLISFHNPFIHQNRYNSLYLPSRDYKTTSQQNSRYSIRFQNADRDSMQQQTLVYSPVWLWLVVLIYLEKEYLMRINMRCF